MRHIIPISGKDSLTTAIVQRRLAPDLPYEYIFNPTGSEYPEVFDWLARVEVYLGAEIARVGADLMEIIEDYNFFLPSRRARYCTKEAKIRPFERWIGKEEAVVYYGIRADEKRLGYVSLSGLITPVYPLVETGVDILGVYRILDEVGLKPPTFFWQSVYDAVCKSLGEANILARFAPWQIDVLFAGRTRANCYHCFNQRLYEWVWLLETHPDLFWKAEEMERKGGDKPYTWNGTKSLQQIADERERIKGRHIKKLKAIISKAFQSGFEFPQDEPGFIDTLNDTSCGLFCGK